MSLADKLGPEEHPDARRTRSYPDEVRFRAGEPSEAYVNFSGGVPDDERAWRRQIKHATNLEVPEDRRVELISVRMWGPKDEEGRHLNTYARFDIKDRDTADPSTVDAVALLREIRAGTRKPSPAPTGGDSAFVLSFNDWQAGKLEGGGTRGLVERLEDKFRGAVARIRELRRIGRRLDHLVIIGGADLIEGCSIFPNQAYEIDSDRRGQVNTVVACILAGLDLLASMFERVTCLVVGGNHGENRIDGKRTTRTDNDDCAVFEHVARATQRDPRLGHVEYVIAQGEPAKTMRVCGWILGTTHGHVYGRGSGSVEQKALKWFMGQAAGRHPVGDADVLVSHHFHHFQARDWGATLWIQTPAMDGGSLWLTDMNGQSSEPGMLSFVMTPGSRCQDLQIL